MNEENFTIRMRFALNDLIERLELATVKYALADSDSREERAAAGCLSDIKNDFLAFMRDAIDEAVVESRKQKTEGGAA